jgi:hypothetical protein
MNHEEATRARREALQRAAEIERRLQNALAERQRAAELFSRAKVERSEPAEERDL